MGPAKRAVGVGPEPRVDAGDVEGVTAFGQQPESLVLSKLVKTNRTLRPFDQPFVPFVLHDRYGVYDRLLQPHGSDEPDVMINRAVFVIHQPFIISAVRLRKVLVLVLVVVVVVPPIEEAEAGLGDDDVVADEEGEAGEECDDDD